MKALNFHRILLFAGPGALTIVYLILWLGMINDPQQRTGSDFIALYSAGRVARQEGFPSIYEIDKQQDVQEVVVGFTLAKGQVLLYNHVPFLVPVIALVSGEQYVLSFLLWLLILLIVFNMAISVLVSLLRRENWVAPDRKITWVGMLLFYPLFISLMNGQDTGFAVLGASLWLFGLLTKRYQLAGLGLSLLIVRPHLALAIALPFIFRLKRVFAWFGLGVIILGVFSLAIVGIKGMLEFFELLQLSAGGEFFGMQEAAMVNLVGGLVRIFPAVDLYLVHWIGWGAYVVAIIALCVIWIRIRVLGVPHFALAVILSLFFAPHLHYHDLTLLLIPVACLMLLLFRSGRLPGKTIALLPLVISLFLLLGSLVPGMKYILPFVVMLILAVLPWKISPFFQLSSSFEG